MSEMQKEKLQLTRENYKGSSEITTRPIYANKIENLEKMDKFLKIYSLLVESGRIENMKRPIINNEIKAVVKIKQKASNKSKCRTKWLHW